MNYCLNAMMHGGNQPVALLVCFLAAFSLSALLGLVVSYRLLDKTRLSMKFRSNELTGQSITWSLNQVLVALAVRESAKSRCISIKLVSRGRHEVLCSGIWLH
ncbi:hypothetical protein CHARACLAT_001200 [Characodon lateralis]|uniref:Uncharacterized protein n=1 Tax=Characodon lateralis TaxID=208331 RepID=A0ABU7CTS0_9TELE|nr:hypothetical protein [Characodon lateralis]